MNNRNKWILAICVSLIIHVCQAQNSLLKWSQSNISSVDEQREIDLQVDKFALYQLNFNQVQKEIISLNLNPDESALLQIPLPDGTFEWFEISRNQVLPESLVHKYPMIGSFTGVSQLLSNRKIYMDITPHGFHGMIIGYGATIFIDPYYKNDVNYYVSYFKKDFRRPTGQRWSCEHQDDQTEKGAKDFFKQIEKSAKAALLTKQYDLAVATTGEYTAIFGGTVTDGLAAVVTAINRVTGVYESELGVKLALVSNNDQLIYTSPNSDPFDNSNNDIDIIQGVIDGEIGSGSYDVGHIFTTSSGGIAGLGIVCSSSKAEGLTGLPDPTGDPFYIDFVAHELGHQFGANHTFNGNSGNCSGSNINGPTAYEPGSGSTIMAYAGICGNDDLQNNSDPYFHLASLMEITEHINGLASGCATTINNNNTMPTVNANLQNIDNKVIPQATPFEVEGDGSDPDGDYLTYQWDEWDLGPQRDVNAADNGLSPLFRSYIPTTSHKRIFPRLEDLLNNTTVIGETLPTSYRNMELQFIVRDNVGGWMNDTITLVVEPDAGPFLVTSQNSATTLSGSTNITWDVAGTDANGINCSQVDIWLSVNGGLTFDIQLADAVSNNGNATVIIPNISTDAARLKVKCSDNVFFDINNVDISIAPPCNVTGEITDDPIADDEYFSNTELLASGRIPSGGNVSFTGETSVVLKKNFTIDQSGVLSAFVGPCSE